MRATIGPRSWWALACCLLLAACSQQRTAIRRPARPAGPAPTPVARPFAPPPEERLCAAAWEGNSQAVVSLLDTGLDVNAPSGTGKTALLYACQGGRAETVKLLLARGADVGARDRHQATAAHYAATIGALGRDGSPIPPATGAAIIGLLADARAELDARDDEGSTALHLAANLSAFDCRDAPDGETVHFEEQTAMAAAIATALLSRGAAIDARDAGGRTPLHLAAAAGNLVLVRLLVEKGADIAVRDRQRRTAAALAVENGHTEVVEYLAARTRGE